MQASNHGGRSEKGIILLCRLFNANCESLRQMLTRIASEAGLNGT
jgi:hypothetical protein